jgi:hypothetical protein
MRKLERQIQKFRFSTKKDSFTKTDSFTKKDFITKIDSCTKKGFITKTDFVLMKFYFGFSLKSKMLCLHRFIFIIIGNKAGYMSHFLGQLILSSLLLGCLKCLIPAECDNGCTQLSYYTC